jgi:hypothetical protein
MKVQNQKSTLMGIEEFPPCQEFRSPRAFIKYNVVYLGLGTPSKYVKQRIRRHFNQVHAIKKIRGSL